MTLSQAMRSGWTDVPQTRGTHIKYEIEVETTGWHRRVAGACALGAVCLGMGIEPSELYYRGVDTMFPILFRQFAMPCACAIGEWMRGRETQSLLTIIVHVNDHHGWPKEQILALVEDCEREALAMDTLLSTEAVCPE
jgi:hypothetical protein